MVDRIRPLKLEDPGEGGTELDQFPTEVDHHEDYVDARGLSVQNLLSDDDIVRIDRDASNNLVFRDPIAGVQRLIDLLNGGSTNYDVLLVCEPSADDTTYEITRTAGKVTRESWTWTDTNVLLKTIAYTRAGGWLTSEVRKIYGPDGITVVAQLTVAYNRTPCHRITGAAYTRDI
jgi:hypothetical protein